MALFYGTIFLRKYVHQIPKVSLREVPMDGFLISTPTRKICKKRFWVLILILRRAVNQFRRQHEWIVGESKRLGEKNKLLFHFQKWEKLTNALNSSWCSEVRKNATVFLYCCRCCCNIYIFFIVVMVIPFPFSFLVSMYLSGIVKFNLLN